MPGRNETNQIGFNDIFIYFINIVLCNRLNAFIKRILQSLVEPAEWGMQTENGNNHY